MDTLNLVSALLGTGAVSVLVVQLLKKLAEGLSIRYGSLITQAILLAVSIVVASLGVIFNMLPQDIVVAVVGVFTSAIAIYEVIVKAVYQQAIKGQE
jgi:hypothetical protein